MSPRPSDTSAPLKNVCYTYTIPYHSRRCLYKLWLNWCMPVFSGLICFPPPMAFQQVLGLRV
jgi:hypothetical protein